MQNQDLDYELRMVTKFNSVVSSNYQIASENPDRAMSTYENILPLLKGMSEIICGNDKEYANSLLSKTKQDFVEIKKNHEERLKLEKKAQDEFRKLREKRENVRYNLGVAIDILKEGRKELAEHFAKEAGLPSGLIKKLTSYNPKAKEPGKKRIGFGE